MSLKTQHLLALIPLGGLQIIPLYVHHWVHQKMTVQGKLIVRGKLVVR